MALARSGATVERDRLRASFDGVWGDLAGLGRDPRSGGYDRFSWTGVDLGLREWFVAEATRRGLEVEVDRNGKHHRQEYAKGGKPQGKMEIVGDSPARGRRSGTSVTFWPDPTVFVAEGTDSPAPRPPACPPTRR